MLQPLAQAGCAGIHIVNRTAARALELADSWRETGAEPQTRVTASGLADAAQSRRLEPDHQRHRQRTAGCRPEHLPTGLYAEGAVAYDVILQRAADGVRRAGPARMAPPWPPTAWACWWAGRPRASSSGTACDWPLVLARCAEALMAGN